MPAHEQFPRASATLSPTRRDAKTRGYLDPIDRPLLDPIETLERCPVGQALITIDAKRHIQIHCREKTFPMSTTRFWERKSLDDMSDEEWEALCDGCGQCCLHKLVNDETADVFYTRVACQLLDAGTGRCTRYAQRLEVVEDCLDVRQMRSSELAWMPRTCAYRRLAEGKPLPDWHPLLTGDPQSVVAAGVAVAGRTISENATDLKHLEAEIIEWVDT